jgi:hypothetical protein
MMATDQQPTLWDTINNAIERADTNADADWKAVAYSVLESLAAELSEITADDIVMRMEQRYPDVTTHNLAALGPVFLRAQKAGLIENTGRIVQSRIPRRHRKITVWRSLRRAGR